MTEIRAGLPLRLLRAVLVALVAAMFGAYAHISANGLMPGGPALLAGFLALVAVGVWALARPASRWRMVALVAGGQLLTHLYLTALAGHAGDHPATAAPRTPVWGLLPVPPLGAERWGSLYDLTTAARPSQGGSPTIPHWLTHVIDDLSGPHALMAIAHLLAAAGVGCWLALGEQALWLLVALVGVVALRLAASLVRGLDLLRRPPVAAPSARPAARLLLPEPLPGPLLGALARRGPPLPAGC